MIGSQDVIVLLCAASIVGLMLGGMIVLYRGAERWDDPDDPDI